MELADVHLEICSNMLEDMDLFKANSALAFFRVHSFVASEVAACPLGGVVLLPPTTSISPQSPGMTPCMTSITGS